MRSVTFDNDCGVCDVCSPNVEEVRLVKVEVEEGGVVFEEVFDKPFFLLRIVFLRLNYCCMYIMQI